MIGAALAVFARHGVAAASLQMIADELGVTKAAIYHQFQTKDDIVRAVVAPALARLAEVTELAERRRGRSARAEIVLAGIVDLVIEHRELTALLQSDRSLIGLLQEGLELQALEQRVFRLLSGPDPTPETHVAVVMASGALMSAATGHHLAHLDDAALRQHLLSNVRRLLRLRTPS